VELSLGARHSAIGFFHRHLFVPIGNKGVAQTPPRCICVIEEEQFGMKPVIDQVANRNLSVSCLFKLTIGPATVLNYERRLVSRRGTRLRLNGLRWGDWATCCPSALKVRNYHSNDADKNRYPEHPCEGRH